MKIKVGDTVMWRGSFGCETPLPAKITGIEYCKEPRSKYGITVDESDWKDKEYLVVTLDNKHWAYGEQLDPA